ncbi:cysteine peptidase family C39 domain-containing protein [Frigoriglobus tundricola]|uniref:Peptidase C39 domain-containing protein n=1 Tax=Frigoriglobus tundricola TaxID=2774151 RepID=A0A6M5YXS5_9BACT|nr:cysteine peptidase family C39 domain-containing protein [Frigoriglobus tundricola]QJW98809.1 hypothetical protein FTUN_6404 [Frigoriglobus tundricola]
MPARGAALLTAVATVALGLLALARLLPFEIERAAFLVGGMRTALCAAGIFLLGVVWGVPGRGTSSSFLFTLAGVALVVIGIEGSGRLWWRSAPGTWDRTVGPLGTLVQSSSVTCAPTAAAMLLHRVGIVAGEGEMAYHAGTSPIGSEPAGVIRALEAKAEPHGWRVAARRTTYDECIGSGPFLAHVREGFLGHALTVIAVTPEGVEVLDPADGLRHAIPRPRFESDWDGVAVHLVRGN